MYWGGYLEPQKEKFQIILIKLYSLENHHMRLEQGFRLERTDSERVGLWKKQQATNTGLNVKQQEVF